MKTYLVNLVLSPGATCTVDAYLEKLKALGYSASQACGSLGGAVNGRCVLRNGSILTRLH